MYIWSKSAGINFFYLYHLFLKTDHNLKNFVTKLSRELDATITKRFSGLVEQALAGELGIKFWKNLINIG